MESRTKNSARNMFVSILMQIISVGLSFVCRTIFARLLETEYLGLSGLFTNVIAVLSLSELGIANVIIVHLYKPLAQQNEQLISKLMNFYRTAYNIIGSFVIICGLIIAPFLKYIVKTDKEIPYIKLYFLLFVIQAATSYFFAYKQTILTADQKEYICSLVRQIFNIIMNLLQIIVLVITKQYIAYLLVSIFTNIGTNIVIGCIADKKFPFLKKNKLQKFTKVEKRSMMKNISSMMLHKIGNTVISSTDNILISSMVGVFFTGLYSNYLLIVNVVTQAISIFFNSISAGIGNFNAVKDEKNKKNLFKTLMMCSYWMFGMCSICFVCLFQPTIELWLGKKFLLDFNIVIIIAVNFFFNGIFRVPSTFIDVNELYVKTKFKPLIMAIINLIISVLCVKSMGLIGVFIGTLFSYLTVGLWVDPIFLYKYVFNESPWKYFFELFINIIKICIAGVLAYLLTACINNYLFKVFSCFLLSNILMFIYYGKTKEFSYVYERIKIALNFKK